MTARYELVKNSKATEAWAALRALNRWKLRTVQTLSVLRSDQEKNTVCLQHVQTETEELGLLNVEGRHCSSGWELVVRMREPITTSPASSDPQGRTDSSGCWAGNGLREARKLLLKVTSLPRLPHPRTPAPAWHRSWPASQRQEDVEEGQWQPHSSQKHVLGGRFPPEIGYRRPPRPCSATQVKNKILGPIMRRSFYR